MTVINPRVIVTLDDDERSALISLALNEKRGPREQAAYLIRQQLEQLDLIKKRGMSEIQTKFFCSRDRPRIVCLCGSTRFWRTFQQASLQETLAGKIVLSIGAASGTDDDHFGNLSPEEYERVKAELDALHLQKINLADEVLILNVDGYIGESTTRELEHALQLGKRVRFWEDPDRQLVDKLTPSIS